MTIHIQNGDDKLCPGATFTVKSNILARNRNFDNSTVTGAWVLVDSTANVVMQGDVDSLSINGIVVSLEVTITLPEDLPTTNNGEIYSLFFEINDSEVNQPLQLTEEVIVYSTKAVTYGIEDTVAMEDYPIQLKAILQLEQDDDVVATLFDPAQVKLSSKTLTSKNSFPDRLEFEDAYETDTYWIFANGPDTEVVFNPYFVDTTLHRYRATQTSILKAYDPENSQLLGLKASLDPYMMQWSSTSSGSSEFIGTSQHWIINNNISSAMHEMRAAMDRALRYPGLIESAFTNAEYVQFLKMGRDLFNTLEKVSNFSMLGADGHMRRCWLICAQYEAASSRQLEEALKAFDFSGQSTSLTIDVSAAYESYKSSLESQLESVIKPYKRQLSRNGVTSGDGNSATLNVKRTPVVSALTYSHVGSAAEYSWAIDSRFFRLKARMY